MTKTSTDNRTANSFDAGDRAGYARAYGRARARVSGAAASTGDAVEGNPLGILVGGLAVGAIAGALIPRSAKEKELLAPIGRQLGERARAATAAAKEAGRTELEQLGLTKDAARGQARSLLDGISLAAKSAGGAAAKSAAKGPQ